MSVLRFFGKKRLRHAQAQEWEQARTIQCFSRFVRSVEEHHPDHALTIGLEMLEFATSMLLEAYAQCANMPLAELPEEQRRRIKE